MQGTDSLPTCRISYGWKSLRVSPLSGKFWHVAIRATECFRATLRFGPADGYRPLSPSRAKTGGESPVPSRIPFGVQRGAALSSALSEPRLCRQGEPPTPAVLDCTPPFHLPLCPVDRVRSNRDNNIRAENRSHDDKLHYAKGRCS